MRAAAAFALLAVACTLPGCKKHGSLVVVHVTAVQQLATVTNLAVRVHTAQQDKPFTLPVMGGSIPPEQTFGIDLPPEVTGAISVSVDALDAASAILLGGNASGEINVGGTLDLAVTLGGSVVDMGGDADVDLQMPDLAPVICDPRGINMPACVWRWQTPTPVGEDIKSVHSFADNDTFAMTQSGAIMHRDATGWTLLPARPKAAVGTFSGREMVGGRGSITDLYIGGILSPPAGGSTTWEVFHSADKGASWTEEALPSAATTGNGYFDGITVAVNGDVLLAGSWSNIITRNHSTGVWTTFQTDAAGCPPATAGCATNYGAVTSSVLANVVANGVKGLARANVGTNTWTSFNGPNTDIVDNLCNGWDGGSNLRYWGVGYNGVITTSTDSTTWTLQTSNVSALLHGCVAVNQNTAWAFGAGGAIVATTNGGVSGTGTWAGQTSGTSEQLLDGTHSPGTALTIVGANGTILRSMNGGTTYTNEKSGPGGNWIAIYGITPQNVYAAGTNGEIVHTTDGLTWQSTASTGTTANLIAMWASSANDVYAVGSMGTLVHSTNGTSFTKYANPGSGGIPSSATLVDIAGLAANNVFVAADTGLYRSTDGGASFAPVTISGFTGTQVSALWAMAGGLWVGGTNGQIYYTTDGVSFASQTLTGVGASLTITRIRGRAPSELYAASTAGAWLAHSTNGGMSWTNGLVTSLFGSGAYDLAVMPSGAVYASGGGLLISQDSGANFVPVNTAPVPNDQFVLYAPSDSEIFATASGGIVHFGN